MVDMDKLLAIAWNHIRIEFEDRSTIVFFLILPLVYRHLGVALAAINRW
jgi:hypothetical protein